MSEKIRKLRALGREYISNPQVVKKEILEVFSELDEKELLELKKNRIFNRFFPFVRGFKVSDGLKRNNAEGLNVHLIISGQVRGLNKASDSIKKLISELSPSRVSFFTWDRKGVRLPSSNNNSTLFFYQRLPDKIKILIEKNKVDVGCYANELQKVLSIENVVNDESELKDKYLSDDVYLFDESDFELKNIDRLESLKLFSSENESQSSSINMLKMVWMNKQTSSFLLSYYEKNNRPDIIFKVRPDVILNDLDIEKILSLAVNGAVVIDSNRSLPFSGDQFFVGRFEDYLEYSSLNDLWDMPLNSDTSIFNINAPHGRMTDLFEHYGLAVYPYVGYKKGFDNDLDEGIYRKALINCLGRYSE